jgi:hypothetical protein
MLETHGEKSLETLNLSNLLNEINPNKDNLSYISNLCKQRASFDSIQAARDTLSELEEKQLVLSEILNNLNELKRAYLENRSYTDESIQNSIRDELGLAEELHKNTSVDLKIRIRKLDSLLAPWTDLDKNVNELESKFSKKLDSLIDCNYCDKKLNLNLTKRILRALKESGIDLAEIEQSLTQTEINLDIFKSELFAFNSASDKANQFSVYNTYLLKLDKFKFKFNYIKEIVSRSSELKLNAEDELAMNTKFTSTSNLANKTCSNPDCKHFKHEHQFSFKSNARGGGVTSEFSLNEGETSNNLMTNIHLDFQLNDSIDESSNYQKTSTPRYRHLDCETPGSKLNYRMSNEANLLKQAQKTYSDKSIATVDDKSSQTDLEPARKERYYIKIERPVEKEEQASFVELPPSPKSTQNKIAQQPAYRSLDSGIMCGALDNTNATTGSDNGSYSSTPFSNSFNANKTESSELIADRANKKLDESVKYSKSLPHVDKISNIRKMSSVSLEPIAFRVNELKLRKPVKENEPISRIEAIEEVKSALEANCELAEQEESVQGVVEDAGAVIVAEVEAKTSPKRKFSFVRFFCYGLLFAIMLGLLLLIVLPYMMPACCDYRKEFLIFNEKFIYDDDKLPPV